MIRNLSVSGVVALFVAAALLLAPPVQAQEDPTVSVLLSQEYLKLIDETPGDFDWAGLAEHLEIRIEPGSSTPGSYPLQLVTVGVRDGDIIGQEVSGTFEAAAEDAFEEGTVLVFEPELTVPGVKEWFPAEQYAPTEPAEYQAVATGQPILEVLSTRISQRGTDEAVFLYARLADDQGNGDVRLLKLTFGPR